jgi:orotidine-5'-phosphate decarboxylase
MAEIIIALDYPESGPALDLVDRVGADADFYKVGLELYTRSGPEIVQALASRGKRVFLDLKLHDIPNTVAGGVRSAAEHGVDLLTVHAAGGPSMLARAAEAAREAAESGGHRVRIVAVTVLTSLPAFEVEEIWGRTVDSVRDEVLRLASMAGEAGIDGVVSSALEAEALRHVLGPDALLVTPGIRPAGAETHDQARVATPALAVAAGASHLVVGRSITQAADPRSAYRAIAEEAAAAAAGGHTPGALDG